MHRASSAALQRSLTPSIQWILHSRTVHSGCATARVERDRPQATTPTTPHSKQAHQGSHMTAHVYCPPHTQPLPDIFLFYGDESRQQAGVSFPADHPRPAFPITIPTDPPQAPLTPSLPTPTPLLAAPQSLPLIEPPRKSQYFGQAEPLGHAIRQGNLKEALQLFRNFAYHHPKGLSAIYSSRLHGLLSLLAGARPQRRENYGHMLEVVSELRRRGLEKVREWEWNALMDCSAKGFRDVTAEDYQSAVDVLEMWEEARKKGGLDRRDGPSIVTYNILVSIAAHAGDEKLVQDALRRLRQALLRPDRITYLSQVTLHRQSRTPRELPGLLHDMLKAKMRIGTDGANALIWAYAHHGDMRTAGEVYDFLVRNASGKEAAAPLSLRPLWSRHNPILNAKGVAQDLRHTLPDFRTHLIMLQSYAYRGDLSDAISVLQHFLSSLSSNTPHASLDQQTMTAFRALFIGFVRHAVAHDGGTFGGVTLKEATALVISGNISPECAPPVDSPYTLDALSYIFRSYIILSASLPSPRLPPTQFVRALLLAFEKTSGRREVVREVWTTLVRERLSRSRVEWERAKESWAWAKIRRDFKLPEEVEDRDEA